MYKKFLASGFVLSTLFLSVSLVSAEDAVAPVTTSVPLNTTAVNRAADVAAKIACVKTAVATRETSLATAVASHSQSVQAAYATRANELAGAYSNTTAKTLRAGTKVAWAGFNKSMKAATKTWKESKNAAWTAYRTAVKDCKATSDISDASNSGSELSGQ